MKGLAGEYPVKSIPIVLNYVVSVPDLFQEKLKASSFHVTDACC